MYTTKQIVLVILITGIIFTGIGFFIGQANNTTKKTTVIQDNMIEMYEDSEDTFQAGWEAAEQRLSETGFVPMIEEEIYEVSGEVISIDNNEISLKIDPLTPLASSELDERIVLIDNSTSIYLKKEKTMEIQEREMEEFENKMKEFEENMLQQLENSEAGGEIEEIEMPTPPEFYTEEKISLSNIEVGQRIEVTAENDITAEKEFTATKILVQ